MEESGKKKWADLNDYLAWDRKQREARHATYLATRTGRLPALPDLDTTEAGRKRTEYKWAYFKEKLIGADYYNLDGTRLDRLDTEFQDIYLRFHGYPIDVLEGVPMEFPMDEEEYQRIIYGLLEFLLEDLPIYRAIVDKLKTVPKEKISEQELAHMERRLAPDLTQVLDRNTNEWVIHKRAFMGHMFQNIYNWLLLLSCGAVQVGTCELEGCDKLFVIGGSGYPKKYCTGNHKVRAFRLRKEEKQKGA